MKLQQMRESLALIISRPVTRLLVKTGLSPNSVTLFGFAVSLGASAAIATGHLLGGGLLVLISGMMDIADGALARTTKKTTKFGALLDSTLDRISEAALLFGLLLLYSSTQAILEIVLTFIVLTGSFIISYVRARAEGLGLECKVGLFTRAERVVILVIGLLLNQVRITLMVLAVLTWFTVIQRLLYVHGKSKE